MSWANSDHRVAAGNALITELLHQQELKAQGKFPHTCEDPELTDGEKLAILVEEVGEVARALQSRDLPNLVDEITQVAAISVAWLAGLYQQHAPKKPKIFLP